MCIGYPWGVLWVIFSPYQAISQPFSKMSRRLSRGRIILKTVTASTRYTAAWGNSFDVLNNFWEESIKN